MIQDDVLKNHAEYAYDTIKKICDEVGPGVPCSPQERARAMIIKGEMEAILGKDDVDVESFSCAPGALFGWLRIGVGLSAVSLALHYVSLALEGPSGIWVSLASFVAGVLVPVMGACEFLTMKEFVDPLLPKRESLNVVGRMRPPKGEAEQLLIFSGHHDSAFEFTWARYFKLGYYVIVALIFLGILTLAAKTGIYAAGRIFGSRVLIHSGSIGFFTLVFLLLPYLVFAFFFTERAEKGGSVPGAADNLSGCCLTLAIARILKDQPELQPDGTEIRFITFGCEEVGMRGAKRYVERHLGELKEKNAMVFNIDTVTHPVMYIMNSDVNGFIKNSLEMVEGMAKAAETAGVPFRIRPFPFGGGATDAYPFTVQGIQAATLMPVDYPVKSMEFYHQYTDNIQAVSIEPFVNLLKLAAQWLALRNTPSGKSRG